MRARSSACDDFHRTIEPEHPESATVPLKSVAAAAAGGDVGRGPGLSGMASIWALAAAGTARVSRTAKAVARVQRRIVGITRSLAQGSSVEWTLVSQFTARHCAVPDVAF